MNFSHFTIGDETVPTERSAVGNLGSWFDSNFKMTTQINKICQSVFYHLHNIRQIRKFLSTDNTKLLVQAVIVSQIDYCNSLLYGVLAINLSKLQQLQNTAVQLITCPLRKSSIEYY